MTSRNRNEPHRTARRWHGLAAFLAAGVLGGMLLLWAWNTLAVELFALPEARFRHVLAFQAGLVGLYWIAARAAEVFGMRRPHKG